MSVTGHIIGNWNLTGEVNETGEGANVVPNPPEEATDTLEKIGIDDVVYSITGEQEQADWDQSDPTAVDYIKNKPTIPAAQVNSDWDAASGVAQILNKPTIPAAQVNSDWDAASGVAQILNKPTLATVATSGEAEDVSYDNTVSGMTATDVQAAVDELKSNFSQLDGLTVYKNLTPQTSYADFDDGSTLPLISLTSNIDPIQDLHGYDYPWSGGAGKNKLNPNIDDWTVSTYRYVKIPNFNNKEYVMSFTDKDTSIDITDVSIGFMYNYPNENTQYRWVISNGVVRANKSNISEIDGTTKCDTIIIYPNTTEAFNKLFSRYNIQVEKGSTATTYETYSNECPISGHTEANVVVSPSGFRAKVLGQTYNIQFKDGDNPLTVYGGTLDVVSGELKVVPYYASYNGETLEGEWISDRDVYAVGTTPTIGAQVVNIGATPQTYQLTPTQVNSLLGQNYISSDTGNITNIKYLGILNLS